MTEKEFRKLVTDLELSRTIKNEVSLQIEELQTILTNNLSKTIDFVSLKKVGSLAKGTMLSSENKVDLLMLLTYHSDKSFKLVNQLIINDVFNIIVLNFDDITKVSDIEYNSVLNALVFKIKELEYSLLIRYTNQNEDSEFNHYQLIDKHIAFTEYANLDYTYFRNTMAIIKNYRNEQKINISGHLLEILLYYSLNEYFQGNRYENYLDAFIKGIDDFLKQKKIEVSSDMYQKLQTETNILNQHKGYAIIDVADPNNNLTKDITEIKLADYRKLRKAISKLIDATSGDLTKDNIVLDINPKVVNNMYVWTYRIENSKFTTDGGSYPMTPENKLTAMLKALSKGLKVIVENNLNKKQIKLLCSEGNILNKEDLLSSENNSRKKTIVAYMENNKITIQ